MSTYVLCSIPECAQPVCARTWCRGHYARWKVHGDPLAGKPVRQRPVASCSVDGCDRHTERLGICKAHLDRLTRTGSVKSEQPVKVRRTNCEVEGCSGQHSALGLCNAHYLRLRAHGSLELPPPNWATGDRVGTWRGDEVGYPAAHFRVVRRDGSASLHLCVNCGGRAMDWAYDHRDPNELQCSETRRKYSADPDHYVPLCRPCHKRIDNAARRGDLDAARLVMSR